MNILRTDLGSIVRKFGSLGFFNLLSDENYLKLVYLCTFKKKLNLNNPKTFNEKLQWAKIYDRNDEYIKLVDKYLVRDYVKDKIGSSYLVPLLGKWNRPEEIEFESLPNKFVLKCNHDSGSVIICKDKEVFNKDEAINKLRKKLKSGTFLYAREWPYKNVEPCIIAEEYIESMKGDIDDYKFFCFDGNVKFFKVDFDRFSNHKANYYNIDLKEMPFREEKLNSDFTKKILNMEEIKKMIEISEKLSSSATLLAISPVMLFVTTVPSLSC